MSKLVRLSILGVLIQVIAILSFIGVAKTAIAVPGKQIALAFFVIAIMILYFFAVNSIGFRELILLAVIQTISFVGTLQILGFAFFPGLAKDLVPLSFGHLTRVGVESILLFLCYLSISIIFVAIKWFLRKKRDAPPP